MGLMISELYAIQGTLLVSIPGPRGGICMLVGRLELEPSVIIMLQSRVCMPAESSDELTESIVFAVISGMSEHFCEPMNRRRSLRELLEIAAK